MEEKLPDFVKNSVSLTCILLVMSQPYTNFYAWSWLYTLQKKWISSNEAIILELQASLGKLRRNDALSCIIWKSVISEKTCCFILPDNLGGKHDDNRSMNKGSVDYENDKHLSVLRFSTKILKILHLTLKLLNNMALITLSSSGATTWSSCYGCVFDWVGMSGLLWPLWDYSKVAEF
ncbi:hypothetical protein RirG_259320 [Rhizophagus irregularis DAOM 197198w]|uniref:Uncharacterized protein n=1 Tax=Rhizophagus irregularis (strain DAOM 197198w) TaxID=1432141 RepID=A0A015LA91_RHIIW|nr:hypothetical protein RirG_259320 [Rhizophagus irregularis DAOM 197198w]